MTWNYRVTKRKVNGHRVFEIHEVYYDGNGVITSWSLDAIAPWGLDRRELQQDLVLMVAALAKPTVNLDKLAARRKR